MNFIGPAQKPKNLFNKKTKLVLGLVVAAIAFLLLANFVAKAVGNKPSSNNGPAISVDKTFQSTGRTKDGRLTDGTLPIKITTAEITDNILVKGQKATTRNGKLFLLVYLEIENKYQVALYSKPVDLLRLVRTDGKRIAPSVSQGDVEIRPLSVKRTNVAFVIDAKEKNFTIEVGEVKGNKEAIQINFK